MKLGIIYACMAIASSAAFSYEVHTLSRCQGGEGGGFPHMQSYTPSINALVKTDGLVSDFHLFEKTNKLIYRTPADELRVHDLAASNDVGSLGEFCHDMSRAVDPSERFVTSIEDNMIKDTQSSHGWKKIPYPKAMSYKPAFWEGTALYSVAEEPTSTGKNFHLASYDIRKGKVHSCSVAINSLAETQLAVGHSYPYIFFYQQVPMESGYKFRTYKIRVSNCAVDLVAEYQDPMPGRVLNLYHYEQNGGNVIQIDHPTKNLLWDRGPTECVFYNVGGRKVFPLLGKMPYVATYKHGEGLGIINVKENRAAVLKDSGKAELFDNNLWITRDSKTLFLAHPVYSADDTRVLMKIEMDNLPTN